MRSDHVDTIREHFPVSRQGVFELGNEHVAEYVLYEVGSVIDVCRGGIGVFEQVHLPQAVVPGHPGGLTSACFREMPHSFRRAVDRLIATKQSDRTAQFPDAPPPRVHQMLPLRVSIVQVAGLFTLVQGTEEILFQNRSRKPPAGKEFGQNTSNLSEEYAQHEERSVRHDNGRSRRHSRNTRTERSADVGSRGADERRQRNNNTEPVRPETRGRRWQHQYRDNEDYSDGLKAYDGDRDNQRHKKRVETLYRPAVAGGEIRVKGKESKLFKEQDRKDHYYERSCSDEKRIFAYHRCGSTVDKVIQTGGGSAAHALNYSEQYDAETEEHTQNHAERSILRQAGETGDDDHAAHTEQARDQRFEKQQRQTSRVASESQYNHERGSDARKGRVADRVDEERSPPQKKKYSDHSAGNPRA